MGSRVVVRVPVAAGAATAWGRLDKVALEGCICSIVLALAAIMAGSGHLPTLRLVRGERLVFPALRDPGKQTDPCPPDDVT